MVVNIKNVLSNTKYLSLLTMITTLSLISSSNATSYKPWDAVSENLTDSMTEILPYTGRKIAIVDNGFVTEHPGLYAQLTTGYNGRDHNDNVQASVVTQKTHHGFGKTAVHGTFVAGIEAQMNPHVDIVPIKRGAAGHRRIQDDVACLKALINRHDIEAVNLSFGIDWKHLIDPIIKLAQAGKTVVIAAGNSSSVIDDPLLTVQNKSIRLSAVLKSLNGRVVIVAATEKVNGIRKLASYSNIPCSTLAEFFISAPGSKLLSYCPLEVDPTGMKSDSGTSLAAPIFMGAMMRLATKFNISTDIAREALFKTAIKGPSLGQGEIDFVAAYKYLSIENLTRAQIWPYDDNLAVDETPINSDEQEDLLSARIFDAAL